MTTVWIHSAVEYYNINTTYDKDNSFTDEAFPRLWALVDASTRHVFITSDTHIGHQPEQSRQWNLKCWQLDICIHPRRIVEYRE